MKRLEVIFLLVGALCFVYCAASSYEAYASKGKASALKGVSVEDKRTTADVIGTIRIPQLGLSAPITNDINRIELVRGVGHIPGTAFAGGLGTVGLAGHRDTFFRELRRVKPGMHILLTDASGEYQYDVESMQVVEPSEVQVLGIQTKPKLVLVTCYPFAFIGAAPQRYIVTAALRSVSGDAP